MTPTCPACVAAGRVVTLVLEKDAKGRPPTVLNVDAHNRECARNGERVYRVNGKTITGTRRLALAAGLAVAFLGCGRTPVAPFSVACPPGHRPDTIAADSTGHAVAIRCVRVFGA